MKKKIIDGILIALLVTAITAGTALLFNDTESEWYLSLTKPSIQPPPIVFGIVWAAVYLLLAASLALSIIKGVSGKAYVLYGLMSVLNILWCLLFFTLHLTVPAFAVIIAYLTVTYLAIRELYGQNKLGACLLLPQALWLLLASVINYLIILLN